MRKLVIFAAAASALLLGACNTVQSAGRDLRSLGDAVTDVAR